MKVAYRAVAGVVILVILTTKTNAQTADPESDELYSEKDKSENTDMQRMAGIVEAVQEKPDVNLVRFESVRDLPCLNPNQAEAFIAHRMRYGPILCAEELAVIPGFDSSIIDCMTQYLQFPVRFTMPDEISGEFIEHLSLELTGSVRRKTVVGEYISRPMQTNGDAYQSSLRIRMSDKSGLKAGINLEKDAYESWWNRSGPDHCGWFVQYALPKGKIRLIAGDYSADIGQGLLFGKNAFGAAGGNVTGLIRVGSGLRAHSSMSESGYMKGVGFNYRNDKYDLTAFGSVQKTDGRITQSEDSTDLYFKEESSGYHRTMTESAYAGTGRSSVIGGRFGYTRRNLTTGVNLCRLHHELPGPLTDEPYARFIPREKETIAVSADFRNTGKRTLVFGETAMDNKGAVIHCSGLLLHPDRNVSVGLLLRHRDRDFGFPFSNPVGYATTEAGESGMLTLFNIRMNDRLSVQLYHDRYSLSWLGYHENSLARGGSEAVRILVTKGKATEGLLQFRLVHSTEGTDPVDGMAGTEQESDFQFRAQIIHRPVFGAQYKTRIETKSNLRTPKGIPSILVFHEIRYRLQSVPLTVLFRLSLYRTNGYANAIYSQESMPLYQFGSTLHYGTGWRNFLMVHMDITRKLDIWMRLAHTRVFDRVLNDDFSGVKGPASLESDLQIRWRFR